MPDTPNDQPTGDLPSNDDGVLARWMDAVNAEDAAQADDKAGDQIGAYKLLRQLGEGGFGTVWLAERKQPFTQRVALKLIKPGMDSKSVIARFEQERQALAVMNHPGIAKVLDGGLTPKGRPYFAMEFVKGEPLTEFCDHNHLSIRDRLELFAQACEAVQHAHLKGIVHRDLKPSNILAFAVEGEKPRLKVIDFGVAKAMSQTLTEKTIFTETGQMIGTPAYMSPEQADPSLNDIDTRSDVYSLGVLLYELVTGALPFDPMELRSKGIGEIQRIIREEEPPTPSARLTTLALKDLGERAAIERARGVAVDDLARQLRSELEWIPLKAMRKEPHRRYQTAAALAEEVRNYLEGRPLLAAPESSTYRLKKYMLRNRALLAGASAVGLALLIGLTAAVLLYVDKVDALERAEQSRKEATQSREDAEQNLNAMKEAKADADAKAKLAEERRQEAERAKDELSSRAYFENIQLAGISDELGDTNRLRERLAACEPGQQNWEWSYLKSRSEESLQTLLCESTAARFVAFSGDGTTLLSMYRSGHAALWRTDTGELIDSRSDNEYLDATFGESARELLLLHTTGVETWRPSSKEVIATDCRFEGKDGRILWIPNGRPPSIVVLNNSGGFKVWRKSAGKWIRDWSGGPDSGFNDLELDAIEYSSGAERFLVHTNGGVLKGYDLANKETEAVPYGSNCDMFASAPNGTLIATASDKTATVWQFQNGERRPIPLRAETGVAHRITRIKISATGAFLAVARRRALEVWRVKDSGPEVLFSDTSSSKDVSWIAFSPDESRIAWGTKGGMLHIREVDPDSESRVLRGHKAEILSGAWHPDGALLATSSEDGEIRLWDPLTPSPKRRAGDSSSAEAISALCASMLDHTCQVAFSSGGTVYIASNADLQKSHEKRIANAQVHAIDLHPNRQCVAIATSERKLYYWDVLEEKTVEVGSFEGRAKIIRFAPKGDVVAVASSDYRVCLFDVERRCAIGAPIELHGELTLVEFNSRGRYMATVARDEGLSIWETSSNITRQAMFRPRDGSTREVLHAKFDNTFTSMFVVTANGSVYRWDWVNDEYTPILDAAQDAASVLTAAWDADRELLLIVNQSGAAFLRNRSSALATPLAREKLAPGVTLTSGTFLPCAKGTKPRVLTTSMDGSVQLWDVETGSLLLDFPAEMKEAVLLRTSPDGTRCLIGAGDGTIRVLDIVPYRIRFAESQLRDLGTPENLGALYFDEKQRGDPSSATWLTDPSKAKFRPKSFLRTKNDLP